MLVKPERLVRYKGKTYSTQFEMDDKQALEAIKSGLVKEVKNVKK